MNRDDVCPTDDIELQKIEQRAFEAGRRAGAAEMQERAAAAEAERDDFRFALAKTSGKLMASETHCAELKVCCRTLEEALRAVVGKEVLADTAYAIVITRAVFEQARAALSASPQPAAVREVTEPSIIEKAYGMLWHDTPDTINSGSYHARKLLLSTLDKKGQRRGIQWALDRLGEIRPQMMEAPAAVQESDRVYDNKILGYAERLTVALAKKFYPENEIFRPLKGDLYGLIMQIDNMTTGLERAQPAAVREVTEEMLRKALVAYWGYDVASVDTFRVNSMRAALEAALAPPETKS